MKLVLRSRTSRPWRLDDAERTGLLSRSSW